MIQAEQPVSCRKYLSDGQKRPDSAIDQVVTSCPFPNPSEASWPQLSLQTHADCCERGNSITLGRVSETPSPC
jgi:hypothetical protein